MIFSKGHFVSRFFLPWETKMVHNKLKRVNSNHITLWIHIIDKFPYGILWSYHPTPFDWDNIQQETFRVPLLSSMWNENGFASKGSMLLFSPPPYFPPVRSSFLLPSPRTLLFDLVYEQNEWGESWSRKQKDPIRGNILLIPLFPMGQLDTHENNIIISHLIFFGGNKTNLL